MNHYVKTRNSFSSIWLPGLSYLDLCKLDGFGAEAFALQMAPEAHLEYHPIASYHDTVETWSKIMMIFMTFISSLTFPHCICTWKPKRQQKGSKSNPSLLFDMFQISIRCTLKRYWQVPDIAWECALMYFSSFSIKSSLKVLLHAKSGFKVNLQLSGKDCRFKVVKIYCWFRTGQISNYKVRQKEA